MGEGAECFRRPVYKSYRASRCSVAWILKVLRIATLIFVPFIIAYQTRSLWKKTQSIREQPKISWKHKIITHFEDAGSDTFFVWSSIRAYNDLFPSDSVRTPSVQTSVRDENLDGLADVLDVEIKLPLGQAETISRFTGAMFVDVALQATTGIKFEGMIYLDYAGPSSGQELSVVSDLNVYQKNILLARDYGDSHPEFEFLPESALTTMEVVRWGNMLRLYNARNNTLRLRNPMYAWTSGPSGGGVHFTVRAQFRIPQQEIQYIPGFMETMKFAWMQFLAVWVLVYAGTEITSRFLYEHQLAETHIRYSDHIPPKGGKFHDY